MKPADHAEQHTEACLPSLHELGSDLLEVSPTRRTVTIGVPFLILASYFIFAGFDLWPFAVLSVIALCFITYGSSSHDLVHQTLGLQRGWNQFWLSLIELLSFRSGTAYRLSQLHHHQHLLDSTDIEGSAAHMSLLQTLLSGPTFRFRLWFWAWSGFPEHRFRLLLEAMGILLLTCLSMMAVPWTLAPILYAALVTSGSWIFPLVTVYIPHNGDGCTQLTKTRRFQGTWARLLAFDHLYHLEHHLYPAVPHHHWRTLAVRLDPFLHRETMN